MNQSICFSFFRKIIKSIAFFAAMLAFAAPGYAAKPTAPPDKDHPLIGRYEGSVLKFYQQPTFDEASLMKGPVETRGSIPDVLQLEGNVSFYYYELPKERSMLEIHRNYESSLKAKGLEVVFSCSTSNGSCYTDKSKTSALDFGIALEKATNWPKGGNLGLIRNECSKQSGRYLLARREAGGSVTHVSIALCEMNPKYTSHALVAVVESGSMDTDKIAFLDASEMQKSLEATGRVNLYGIYFDTDKDVVKPESKPTLDEISKLMRDNSKLRLQVVGHTDSTGKDAHNKDLSNRRAASVIRALTTAGIDGKRFTSRGAGASEPVAGNDSEEGRAKNRRVELVRQ